jgi:hypothetical protein
MHAPSTILRLADMVQAMERLQSLMDGVTVGAFGDDWQRQWLVERGVRSSRRPADTCRTN